MDLVGVMKEGGSGFGGSGGGDGGWSGVGLDGWMDGYIGTGECVRQGVKEGERDRAGPGLEGWDRQ